MNRKIIAITVMMILTITIVNAKTIEGNKVYINDTNVYLSAEPHTIKYQDEYINLQLRTINYEGNINIIFGYNDNNIKPRTFEIYQGKRNITYDCSYNYADNISVNITTLQNCTYETDNWINIGGQSSLINYNYGGMTKWRYITGLNIQKQKIYNARINMEQIPNNYGKYWFCIYPTSYGENIQLANQNKQLYCLDPWYNITSGGFLDNSLTDGLRVYFSFENNITTLIKNDVRGYNNGTMRGQVNTTIGKIGQGLKCRGVSGAYISINEENNEFDFNGGKNFTMNWWEKTHEDIDVKPHVARSATGTYPSYMFNFWLRNTHTGDYYASTGGSWDIANGIAMTNSVEQNIWIMTTVTKSGNNMSFYRNGTFYSSYNNLVDFVNVDGANFSICAGQGGNINMSVDEFGLWNRTLNQTEISLLWNNGAGLSYNGTDTSYTEYINITLIKPNNNTLSQYTNINISYNFTAENISRIFNCTIFINNTETKDDNCRPNTRYERIITGLAYNKTYNWYIGINSSLNTYTISPIYNLTTYPYANYNWINTITNMFYNQKTTFNLDLNMTNYNIGYISNITANLNYSHIIFNKQTKSQLEILDDDFSKTNITQNTTGIIFYQWNITTIYINGETINEILKGNYTIGEPKYFLYFQNNTNMIIMQNNYVNTNYTNITSAIINLTNLSQGDTTLKWNTNGGYEQSYYFYNNYSNITESFYKIENYATYYIGPKLQIKSQNNLITGAKITLYIPYNNSYWILCGDKSKADGTGNIIFEPGIRYKIKVEKEGYDTYENSEISFTSADAQTIIELTETGTQLISYYFGINDVFFDNTSTTTYKNLTLMVKNENVQMKINITYNDGTSEEETLTSGTDGYQLSKIITYTNLMKNPYITVSIQDQIVEQYNITPYFERPTITETNNGTITINENTQTTSRTNIILWNILIGILIVFVIALGESKVRGLGVMIAGSLMILFGITYISLLWYWVIPGTIIWIIIIYQKMTGMM